MPFRTFRRTASLSIRMTISASTSARISACLSHSTVAQNWARETTGFSNTVVESLSAVNNNGVTTLFAFTHGRGAFKGHHSDVVRDSVADEPGFLLAG